MKNNTKTNYSNNLIEFRGTGGVKQKDDLSISNFLYQMIHYPDQKAAIQIIKEQARLLFTKENGAEINKLELLESEMDKQKFIVDATKQRYELKLKNTPQFIRAETLNSQRVTMDSFDKFQFCLYTVFFFSYFSDVRSECFQ